MLYMNRMHAPHRGSYGGMNMADLLNVKNLQVKVEEKEILHGVDLTVNRGETHVLMGPNGAGKSTLGNALMGNPQYQIIGGKILFNGQDITTEPTDQRAKLGMFLSFQNPLEVPGITLGNFIRSALQQRTGKHIRLWDFKKEMKKAMEVLDMDPSYADRDLNVGFSGGEKKKAEILQLLMLKPSLAILDETDSGLDVDAMRIVADGVNKMHTPETSTIVITHYERLLDMIKPSVVHVLYKGRIVKTEGPELAKEIETRGYDWIKEEIGEL